MAILAASLKICCRQFDLALVLTPYERPEFLHRLKRAGIPQVVWLPSFPVQDRVPIRELHAERLRQVGLKKALETLSLDYS